MIKAVFFDIDGTLVSFETHKVPESTLEAIDQLKKKNIKTFIATGRAFSQISNLGELTFDAYVTLNGGYCLSGNKEVIYKNSIPQEDIRSLAKYQQREDKFPCALVTENEQFINYRNHKVEEIESLINLPPLPIKDIVEAKDTEIFQLLAFFGENEEEEIMKDVFPNCDATRWNPLFTDVIAKGNSKQVGIDKILEHYDIDLSQTMSFGDGGNDIPMLKHTPISVAMGNAEDDVKQWATHVTDSVDNDGIWNALKKLEIL